MTYPIFGTGYYRAPEGTILSPINASPDFLSVNTSRSPRSAGDAIGALGWEPIQIANSNSITVNDGYSRKRWMLEFCDVLLSFYPREIAKIGERISRFEQVHEFWQRHPDDLA